MPKKKLNAKSLRQGQTVYYASNVITDDYKVYGCFIDGVAELRNVMVRIGGTYSRRKAERKAKELNRMMGVNV